jgi:hypothetical protein
MLYQGMAGLCRYPFVLGLHRVTLYPVPNVCKLISHSFSTVVYILLLLITLVRQLVLDLPIRQMICPKINPN